ncbi:glutamine-rich protein 2 [Dipodomys spectabilis]|uniref:glutamine-rich protein 2 n=1 Tax=Dipodomys spectabilis TaxID=105255 RepID=UPI001C547EAA|nr:glutamine-rich protein 2 [Dipodomys spectabilis]
MPPLLLNTRVSLGELVDLAIGTPEVGAVNFTAMHTLLISLLKTLNLQDTTIDYQPVITERGLPEKLAAAPPPRPPPPREKERRRSSLGKTASQAQALESQVKDLGGQVNDLGGQVSDLNKQMKTMDTKVQGIVTHVELFTSQAGGLDQEYRAGEEDMMVSAEPWRRKGQEGLEETASATLITSAQGPGKRAPKMRPEDIAKGPQAKFWSGPKDLKEYTPEETQELLQDLMEEVKTLKDAQQKVQELPALQPLELLQRIEKMERLLRDRDEILEQIGLKLNSLTRGDEVTMVTWEDLEQAITDGWKTSQMGSELSADSSKRMDSSAGLPGKGTSADQAADAAGAPHRPPEKTLSKQLGKPSSTALPGREQLRAQEEAGGPKSQPPPASQADRRKAREPSSATHLRRDERDAGPGLSQQDLSSASQQQPYAQPDQQAGVPIGPGQVYQRPDQPRLGLPTIGQLGRPRAGVIRPQRVPPQTLGHPGMQAPRMGAQGLVTPGMDQIGMMPSMVPGRDQQGLQLPGTDQFDMASFGTYQPGVIYPDMDQQAVMQESGMGVPGMDQSGLIPIGVDQNGFVIYGTTEQGLVPPGIDQYGQPLPLTDQYAFMPPGLMPIGVDQQGFIQPSLGASGFIQPGTEQGDLVQAGEDQGGLVQPGTAQPGLMPPGAVPRGLVQPGAVPYGLAQPGAVQRGLAQSGTVSRGLVQPGAQQFGVVQPGTVPHGLVQPGAVPRGPLQPGAEQLGVGQPGAEQLGLVQPGAVPHGLVQPGAEQLGVGQPGAEQLGLVQPGAEQLGVGQPGGEQLGGGQPGAGPRGMVQPGAGPRGMVQPGAGPRGMVQPGAGPRGMVQPGAGPRGLVQPGAVPQGLVQPGAVPQDLVQPGAIPQGFVQPGAVPRGLVQPRAVPRGFVQPGAVPQGLVQPGAVPGGLVQPGADQLGLVQPGTVQRGLVQPGAGQQGLVQPGTVQRGLVQPGAGQQGLVQPGTVQRGLVQPGAGQQGLVQPGTVQRGLVQPGAGQQGLVQPGTVQHGLVQSGTYPSGLVQPGIDQAGFVYPEMDQYGLSQPGAVPSGLVQPDAYSPEMMQPGVYPPGLVYPGTDPRSWVQPGGNQICILWVSLIGHNLTSVNVVWRNLVQMKCHLVKLSLVWYHLMQFSLVWYHLVQLGLVWCHLVQLRLLGLVWCHLVQLGLVCCHLMQLSLVWCHLMQLSLVWCHLVQLGLVWYHLVQSRLVWCQLCILMVWYHLVQISMVWCNQVQISLVWCNQVCILMVWYHLVQLSLIWSHLVQLSVVWCNKVCIHMVWYHLVKLSLVQYHLVQLSVVWCHQVCIHVVWYHLMQLSMVWCHQACIHVECYHLVQLSVVWCHLVQLSLAHMPPLSPYGAYPPAFTETDQQAQVQAGLPYWMIPSPEATTFRSRDSLSYLQRRSSERMEGRSDRQESLDKLAPSFPMAVETFRLLGELISLYSELKENMKDMKEEAGLSEMEKLQLMINMMVKKSLPDDLQDQLKYIKTLAKEVRQDRIKLDKLQRFMKGDGMGMADGTKEVKTGPLGLQLGILRVTVSDIEKELAELRESQDRGKAIMENSVSEASLYLQEQLDKLRTIIESMLASSSTLLSMSITPEKLHTPMMPGHMNLEATCPACSLDVSHQVSLLVQRYEQLQDMVNSLAASRPSKKAKLQSQDEELLGHVQSAILQVQGDCEKLNITTSNLIEDHRQKQKEIDELYQGIQKLEKEKANRESLEMEIDVKADKSALASKVSRIQFDATTEQLNHMMQELVAKMSGKEQDWQRMLDKLLAEMDNKLDRLELDPVKQSLEDRWKSLRQQLRERPPLYQSDEAAIMRRQLLAHFHCLSCDRPLETPVTGQTIPVTPVGPSLPRHRSLRPYTVYELEQIRQQSRNLKLGAPFARGDQMDRSVGRLRTMHSKMLMDIEKVQIHFGGSVKASSQMIRELMQARCLNRPCYKRVPDSDYTYSTIPRRCGGSHTITSPYRRSRLQHLQGLIPHEDIQIAMKHDEVDILGLDGHIYKGRMDMKLPDILTKDNSFSKTQLSSLSPLPASGMTKHKSRLSRAHISRQLSLGSNGQLFSRPHSAQMSPDNSGRKLPAGWIVLLGSLAKNQSLQAIFSFLNSVRACESSLKQQEEASEGRSSQGGFRETESLPEALQGRAASLGKPLADEEEDEEPTRGPRSSARTL